MKFRFTTNTIDESAENLLAEEVRRLAAGQGETRRPDGAYWPDLLVRTNARIDEVTSPRALTVSWALRVAIPGVVAILSFMVGLHYYAPTLERNQAPLNALVMNLPDEAVDTLLAQPSMVVTGLSIADIGFDPFNLSNENLAEYLVAAGSISAVTEGLTNDQVSEVLAMLGAQSETLLPGEY